MATVFFFVKGVGASEIESLVANAQVAASMDTLETLSKLSDVEHMVVATGNPELDQFARALGADVELDPPGEEFHFGKRLASLVAKNQAIQALYIGGGSGVFMAEADWQQLLRRMAGEPGSVVANNYYSCDFCGWSPGYALSRIEPPVLDNDLAFRLGERAGLRSIPLDKNAATQFDIDTPADLLVLGTVGASGANIQQFLSKASLDTSRVQTLRQLVQSRSATLFIIGRVSASMALYLERETPCQWRILSEERGMRASGREARGQVRSLLGALVGATSPRELVDQLGQLADGVIMDTRVLFAHRHLFPTPADRFYSDLLQPDHISDPFIRELTAAASEAPFPILFGGHSVVSGGMFALNWD